MVLTRLVVVTRNLLKTLIFLLGAGLLSLASATATATIISRTITIDGTITDWTSPQDITTNAGQYADDAQDNCPNSQDRDSWSGGDINSGTCDGLSGGAGRDLRKFAFTYDNDNIYLYVERFASSTNVTDWWFYIDVDNDGLMENSDILYRVKWQGTNQTTDRELWTYTPSAPGGDPLTQTAAGPVETADGYTMPGTNSNRQILATATGGSASGLEMETWIPWSTICGIGCSPQSIGFHISSSNGSNLPSNIIDNMDGPSGGGSGGGAIVILDLGVSKTASVTDTVAGNSNFTYSITVTNEGGGDATGVTVTDVLPTEVTYVSDDSASTGTTFTDSGDADSVPDLWDIGDLADGSSITLDIVVAPTTAGTDIANTADSLTLNESDTDAGNDSDTALVTIRPPPDLVIAKTGFGPFTAGLNETYELVVTNNGTGTHVGTITVTDTLPTGLTYVSASGTDWACSESGGTVTCTWAQDLAGSGTSAPTITMVVAVDSGAVPSVDNTATVTAATFESDDTNNSDTETTTVNPSGNLMCYAVSTYSSTLSLLEVDIGAPSTPSNNVSHASLTGTTHIAYDCASDTLYGVQGSQFGSIDPSTGAFTSIGGGITGVNSISGLAYDPTTGGLYAIDSDLGNSGNDYLIQIDPTTGDRVENAFGNGQHTLNIDPSRPLDLAFDSADGEMLVIQDGNISNDQIVSVDPTTGAGTNLTNDTGIADLLTLSSDNAGTGETIGSDNVDTLFAADNTGVASSLGSITSSTEIFGLDCIYSCFAKLLDIDITKTVDDTNPPEEGTVTYTITATNNGPSTATALQVSDVLDGSLTFDTATASNGTYDETTGIWYIGTLASSGSATLDITVQINAGVTAGTTIDNTASLAFVTQKDTNPGNNADTASFTVSESDLSTSAKTVVDMNGGQPAPGDVLRYTITLTETGGTDAINVSVTDSTPANTTSLTVQSIPAGATDASGTTYDLEITDITVPASSSVTIVFDVTISANAQGGDTVNNDATVTNPSGITPGTLFAPTVNIVKSAETKTLYLGPAAGETVSGVTFGAYALGRLPFTSTTGVQLAGAGGAQTWIMDRPLETSLTLDGTSSGGGVSVPIELVLSKGSAGNRSIRASLDHVAGCTGAATNIGTTADTTVLSSGSGPLPQTLSFNLSGDVAVPAGDCLQLTVTNTTSAGGKTITVHPQSGGTHSRIAAQVFDFIRVDSVEFYDAAAPGGSLITEVEYGDPVFVRATVSDPFGTYDISTVDLILRDAVGTAILTVPNMTQVSSTSSSITYEETTTINSGTPGTWDAYVTAQEGTEGLTEHQGIGSILTFLLLPDLAIDKTADKSQVSSGDSIAYTIDVTNNGPGRAYSVEIEDSLGLYTSLCMDCGATTGPFTFNEGSPVSNLTIGTIEYSNDDGATWIYSPPAAGYDPNVTDWRINMSGVMTRDGNFNIQFQSRVQ